MTLINPSPQAPVLPLSVKQAAFKYSTTNHVTATFRDLRSATDGLYVSVFSNPEGLTPQQAFDALGNDAAQLFGLLTNLKSSLNTLVPDTISWSLPEATINPDGTVTLP